jgi:glycerophosphoryl diester phosphodiesterase
MKRLVKGLVSVALLWFFSGCQSGQTQKDIFDWQGHRGARGQVPENSLPGLQRALQDGVTTLEIDVVITADSVVVLSHEPYLNHTICLDSTGKDLALADTAYNIFKMTYKQLQAFDCGSKGHPTFRAQEKYAVQKPSLLDAILASEETALIMDRNLPFYNIEIKSKEAWDGIFHPNVKTYVELCLADLQKAKITDRVIIQSFDERVLQYLHKNHPQIKLALLVAANEQKTVAKKINELGFYPNIYSCEYPLVNKGMLTSLHAQKVKVIPWTVNEIEEAKRLIDLGVDGIITDFPGRLIPALGANPGVAKS